MRGNDIRRQGVVIMLALSLLTWMAGPEPGRAEEPGITAPSMPMIAKGERLSLQRAVAIALGREPTILAAQGGIAAGESRVGQAESRLSPQVDGALGYNRLSPAGSFSFPTDDTSHGQYNAGVTVNQLIYDFGKTRSRVEIQRTTVDSSRADLASVEEQVIFNVKVAYFDLLKTARTQGVATETVRQFESHLEQAKGFFEAGLKPRYDVTKAMVDLSTARLNLIRAENGLALSRVSLNTAMGMPEAPEYEVTDTLDLTPFTLPLTEALQEAYNRRPDLKALLLRKRAAEQALALARKGDYPLLTGNASATYGGEDLPLDEGWDVGVALSFPLANGKRTSHEAGEAEANLTILSANETGLRNAIDKEVRQGYLNLREAEERAKTTSLAVKEAEENRDIAVGRYNAGVGNPVEVTDADVALANARTNHITALYDYKIAQSSIERAIGVTAR